MVKVVLLSLLLFLLSGAVVVVVAQDAPQDDCTICKVVEPRIRNMLLNSKPGELVDIEATLCGSPSSTSCLNFLAIYGRSLVKRVFLKQTDICDRLPSYHSLLTGVPERMCAATTSGSSSSSAADNRYHSSSLNTYIRVVQAVFNPHENVQNPYSPEGEGIISKTEVIIKENGEVMQTTEQIKFSVDEQGAVTTKTPNVLIEQLYQKESQPAQTESKIQELQSQSQKFSDKGYFSSSLDKMFSFSSTQWLCIALLTIFLMLLVSTIRRQHDAVEYESVLLPTVKMELPPFSVAPVVNEKTAV